MSRVTRKLFAILLLSSTNASATESNATTGPASTNKSVCVDFKPHADDPLSLNAAREAYRWDALQTRWRQDALANPGLLVRRTAQKLTEKPVCYGDLYIAGRLLFQHEFSFDDGLGFKLNEDADYVKTQPFQRVHAGDRGGPDANSCRSCHWRGGQAGAGSVADNAFLDGDGDRLSSALSLNPPSLQGAGIVDALAKEMSEELERLRSAATAAAREASQPVTIDLETKGVSFGQLTIGADGVADTSNVEGIDADLKVRPFGWTGKYPSLREAVLENFRLHLGVVAEGSSDHPDESGELSDAQISAVVTFLAAQAAPIHRPPDRLEDPAPSAPGLRPPDTTIFTDDWVRGRRLFHTLRCSACHTPQLTLESASYEVSVNANQVLRIDLSEDIERPRLQSQGPSGGYPVFLYSDLKRHNMADAPDQKLLLTPPLWGLADSGPWLHDGSATSIDHAIKGHGGEAKASREAYLALTFREAGDLRLFLTSFRREQRWLVP